jgi:hypothetical protein
VKETSPDGEHAPDVMDARYCPRHSPWERRHRLEFTAPRGVEPRYDPPPIGPHSYCVDAYPLKADHYASYGRKRPSQGGDVVLAAEAHTMLVPGIQSSSALS